MKFTMKKVEAYKMMDELENNTEYIKKVNYVSDKVEVIEFKSDDVSYIFCIFNGVLSKYVEYINGVFTEVFVK